mmetsp:Transcript_12475/g.41082  ORF Transcript_12475/g.41082 Transcript_12475/m.41082 type:complete len:1151 (+) Transcript_12475:3-3455(+)
MLSSLAGRSVAQGARPRAQPNAAGSARPSTLTARAAAAAAPAPDATDKKPFAAWEGGVVGKRTDIKRICILGAGPIVIGQACEFDYSGTQACKALRSEGYEVILVNSNPATIMTDPGTADRTYVGPMTPEKVKQILEQEKPDALLPTMGGQTGLNLAKALAESGALEELGIELIGAKLEAINKAEDRQLFKDAMDRIGLKMAESATVETMEDALKVADQIGSFPLIIRPAFTLGGSGGGIAYNLEEFKTIVASGLEASSTTQVLVEKSLLGWKEYELEVMRDLADNVVIVCSIENIDPMGVHTGDSITVAPAQTLTDKEYQRMRDAAVAIIREIGVECGGSNVQFTVNPADGEMLIIEMNPRVSRSSALASKATGFPIAKIAAKLAMGYTLDQIPNDITLKTPASFEPSIDYVVTKIPRFAFEKFPGSVPHLSTQMKSVGEVMAIGRNFQESFQKAMRGLETGNIGWGLSGKEQKVEDIDMEQLRKNLRTPNPDRMIQVHDAFRAGLSVDELFELTAIDPWFLSQMNDLYQAERFVTDESVTIDTLSKLDWNQLKRRGFSDQQLAVALGSSEADVRAKRTEAGVVVSMKRVDTCAAEFEAQTPYMYSAYDGSCEAESTATPKVLILGGGPNRIGQGIEFDYCCCHASFSLQAAGYETIMMNSNPETVSTDYDTSDRLYFEPLTVEDVMNVLEKERPDGIIVQFGGQTPLKLAKPLQTLLEANPIPAASGNGNVRILGTSPDAIDAAEDRERFEACLNKLGIQQPPGGIARSAEEAQEVAGKLGYPVMVRPSYVLGGRAMEIVYSSQDLDRYITTAVQVDPEQPVLVDKYLNKATEVDVDALADEEGNVVIGGIMEHIEQAGVHSGDSACSLPPQTLSDSAMATIREWTKKLAQELKVVGLLNIQYAVRDDDVYIIEANPRASRTVPFVSKAIGHPLAKYASLAMVGQTLEQIGLTEEVTLPHVAVKEAVLPFDKFPGADTLLGPEMRSTGEVMGIDATFEGAYAKAQIAAGQKIPTSGRVLVSVRDTDKEDVLPIASSLVELGFGLVATGGTAAHLQAAGLPCETVLKIHEGRPSVSDLVINKEVDLLIITSSGDEKDALDGRALRRQAVSLKLPLITTLAGASATVAAIDGLQKNDLSMVALQDYFDDA